MIPFDDSEKARDGLAKRFWALSSEESDSDSSFRSFTERLTANIKSLALEERLFTTIRRRILLQKARLFTDVPSESTFREHNVMQEFPDANDQLVRTALWRLVNEALLEQCADGSFRVPPFSINLMVEAYRLRALLELPAIFEILPNASAIAELRSINASIASLPDIDDDARALAAFDLDIDFHQRLLTLGGRTLAAREVRRYHNLILVWNAGIRLPGRRTEVATEHDEILESKTPQEAIEAYLKHFRQGTCLSLMHAGRGQFVETFDRLWAEARIVAEHQASFLN